jgi:hypothetical protein
MKIEFHNAHGNQLILSLSKEEAAWLISDVTKSLLLTSKSDVSHYASFKIKFENDDDRWVPTDFDIVVDGDPVKSEDVGCQSIRDTIYS